MYVSFPFFLSFLFICLFSFLNNPCSHCTSWTDRQLELGKEILALRNMVNELRNDVKDWKEEISHNNKELQVSKSREGNQDRIRNAFSAALADANTLSAIPNDTEGSVSVSTSALDVVEFCICSLSSCATIDQSATKKVFIQFIIHFFDGVSIHSSLV